MKSFKRNKRWQAQQLVEFLLVAPFIIIILGIVMEYAYALNVNMTLANGLKAVTSEIYKNIGPNATFDIPAQVTNPLNQYMSVQNKINSSAQGDGLTVSKAEMGENTVFIAEYIYTPAFTLPQVYFKFMPDKFDFVATSVVPTAFLKTNNYGNGINTIKLNGAWVNPVGVLESPNDGSDKMLFLSPVTAPLPKPYQIQLWWGALQPFIVSAQDGKIYICTPVCNPTGQTLFSRYPDITNFIFVHDSDPNWANVLKRAVSLVDSSSKSVGNYDNLKVNNYNTNVSLITDYTTKVIPIGGNNKVFVYTAADATGSVILPPP